MAIDVSALPDYNEQESADFLLAATLRSKTAAICNKQTVIKGIQWKYKKTSFMKKI